MGLARDPLPLEHRPILDPLRSLHGHLPDNRMQRDQGARCMDCGIPFCHEGCPLGN